MKEIQLTNHKKGRRAPIKVNLKHGKHHSSLVVNNGRLNSVPDGRIDVKGIKLPKTFVPLTGSQY